MWLARIIHGVVQSVNRVDNYESHLRDGKEVRRPRHPRAWRIKHGAAALSQSPEGAIASAKAVLAQPDNSRAVRNTMADLVETMKGSV